MKTNIIKTEIDKRKLQEAIDIFEGVNGASAYLFDLDMIGSRSFVKNSIQK